MDTKSETSCPANDITRRVEKHVFGKDVRRMSDQSPSCTKSTPLVISRAFAAFSWMRVRIRCPVLQVSLPDIYDKTVEIKNELTVLQLLLVDIRLGQTIYGRT